MKSYKMQSLKKLLNVGNLYIFFFVFSMFKYSKFLGQLHWIVLLPFSLIFTVFMCLTLIISAIYYEIVHYVLKLKHGDEYCGIMDGSDVLWVVEEGSSSIINIVYMVDAKDGEGYEPLFEFMQNTYENISKTHYKMSCVRRYFMGYWYYLKTHINIHDYVKYLDDYKDIEEFNLLIDKLSNSPLPAGNAAMWEVYIGKVGLKWKKDGDKVQYPIFMKFNHSLTDGISLVSLQNTQLFENGVNTMKENFENYRNLLKKAELKNSKPTFVENFKNMFNRRYYITYFGLLADKDENTLHGKRLSHEKHVCYSLEKDMTNYMEKVKSIKNRIKGISFGDVIMTALSASCAEYYMTHDKNPPDNIRIGIPYYAASPNFKNAVAYDSNGETIVKLKNNFTIGFLNLLMRDKDIAGNMRDRLMHINKQTKLSKDSLDFPFLFWQLKVVSTIVPFPIIEKCVAANETTVALSSFPGLNSVNLISGHRIRDIIGFAPNCLKCGITFTSFSYDEKFRFGLLVDKEIIKEKSEVQQICDNIFKYIDLLDEKTKACEQN